MLFRSETEDLLGKLRDRIPQLTMRTTFITGFPGETEEHFQELAEFIEQQKFERLGVFTYSLEPDTPAALLPDQVPAEVSERRRGELMQIQQRAAFEWNQQQVGRQMDVILDARVTDQANAWVGRRAADAPDVDGLVFVTGNGLRAGQIVPCEIVTTQGYDLIGVSTGGRSKRNR